MIDKRYFNQHGIILALGSIIIIIIVYISDERVYNYLVVNPSDIATKTNSGIVFKTIIYFIHKNLGKWSIFGFFIGPALLGIITGFDWRRFFDKDK